jgi:hypothetical protein
MHDPITPRPIDWLLCGLASVAFLLVVALLAEYTALEADTAAHLAVTQRIQEAAK